MTDEEIIAVVQAHKEGKKIEYRVKGTPRKNWNLTPLNPLWNFQVSDYRVKHEPQVIYVNEYENSICAHLSKKDALLASTLPKRRAVKYVEVIEEKTTEEIDKEYWSAKGGKSD